MSEASVYSIGIWIFKNYKRLIMTSAAEEFKIIDIDDLLYNMTNLPVIPFIATILVTL